MSGSINPTLDTSSQSIYHSPGAMEDIREPALKVTLSQPEADLSLKKTFQSLIRKPETYFFITAIAALFITPLFISITLSIVALITSIGISYTRSTLLPSGSLGEKKYFNYCNGHKAQNAEIKLSDGNYLRGIWLYKPQPSMPDSSFKESLASRKLLVIFHGNGYQAFRNSYNSLRGAVLPPSDSLAPASSSSTTKKYDLLEMNFRGTANSDGFFSSNKQHVKDGIEIVEAAIEKGYTREHITVVEHSFGGSIAPSVKAHFDKELDKNPISLVAYNTFHRNDAFLSCRFKIPILSTLCLLITKFFLKCIRWDYHYTAAQWNDLKGSKTAFGGGEMDIVIPPPISFASMLQKSDVVVDQKDVVVQNIDHCNIDPLVAFLNKRSSSTLSSGNRSESLETA